MNRARDRQERADRKRGQSRLQHSDLRRESARFPFVINSASYVDRGTTFSLSRILRARAAQHTSNSSPAAPARCSQQPPIPRLKALSIR
jgi:hypothetical protein